MIRCLTKSARCTVARSMILSLEEGWPVKEILPIPYTSSSGPRRKNTLKTKRCRRLISRNSGRVEPLVCFNRCNPLRQQEAQFWQFTIFTQLFKITWNAFLLCLFWYCTSTRTLSCMKRCGCRCYWSTMPNTNCRWKTCRSGSFWSCTTKQTFHTTVRTTACHSKTGDTPSLHRWWPCPSRK